MGNTTLTKENYVSFLNFKSMAEEKLKEIMLFCNEKILDLSLENKYPILFAYPEHIVEIAYYENDITIITQNDDDPFDDENFYKIPAHWLFGDVYKEEYVTYIQKGLHRL